MYACSIYVCCMYGTDSVSFPSLHRERDTRERHSSRDKKQQGSHSPSSHFLYEHLNYRIHTLTSHTRTTPPDTIKIHSRNTTEALAWVPRTCNQASIPPSPVAWRQRHTALATLGIIFSRTPHLLPPLFVLPSRPTHPSNLLPSRNREPCKK